MKATGLHLRTAIEQSPLGTAILDPDGRYLLTNSTWDALWSSGGEAPPEDSNVFENERLRAIGLAPYISECRRDGEMTTPLLFREATPGAGPRWLRAFVYPIRDGSGTLLGMGLLIEDFTERKALEDQLVHRAFHDPLTGLPNRALFLDRLVHALARAGQQAGRGESGGVALMFMDLDDFKRFNDSLGHQTGDQLLAGVAERVAALLRPGDTFARFGGDEFAMLLEDIEDLDHVIDVARRVRRGLVSPFEVGGHKAVVTTSIGIASAAPGRTGQDYAEELMRRSDIAMYRSKNDGKNHYQVFSSGMNHSLEQLKLEEELRRALESGEFRVLYQPQVRTSTGATIGLEALVRWDHPERGELAPAQFITLAEETGMIIPLGRWVPLEACRQARILRDLAPTGGPLMMSVNLSARQFRYPELVEEVSAILSETGMNCPRDLALEITESTIMERRSTALDTLFALKDLGVTLVMDDFGTGYSSITNLKSFPVDVLKMDRSMVEGVDENVEDRAIVSATVSLAHALGLEVVAEGVETVAQLNELRSMVCDFAQGYYWQRPCSAEEVTKLLAAGPNQ